LIEREQRIPARPAPADTGVHLHLVSGSEATVLQVNAATRWNDVNGETLQDTENTGWITPRYLASGLDGDEPPSRPLAWCPPKGSHTQHPSGRLQFTTYTDYERIRCYGWFLDLDVLADQAVDSEEALSWLVDPDEDAWDKIADYSTVLVEMRIE
jgi:hypothetical protein